MLKYLVQLTDDLLVAGLLTGMLYSYIRTNYGRKNRLIVNTAMVTSLIAAIVMAYMIQTTNKVNIGYTNLTMFLLFLSAFLLWVIFHIGKLRDLKLSQFIISVGTAVMIFTLIFYSLPDTLVYPFNFNLSGNTAFSTDFIYRLIGCIAGFILCALAGVAVYKIERDLPVPQNFIFLFAALLINAMSFAGKAIQIMRTRMMIPPSDLAFRIIQITLNYSEYFILGVALVAVLAGIYLAGKNRKVTEEYSNTAELRKIKAKMRRRRRWVVCLVVCAIFATINLTAIDAYNNRGPEEAPVEDAEITEDSVIVPFSMVEDGHLHRFGYTTDDGIQVKFIVVKKPGSTAYGVGLDACDICGDAGYYERGDQIVCKRCDVVMNTNTIGFKGGCNPIVIDYTVENGQIIVPIQTLIDNKDEFK